MKLGEHLAPHSAIQGSVRYVGLEMEFVAVFVDRKSLEIAVHPGGDVVVKAPLGTEMDRIQGLVLKRARWILRQRAYFKQFDPRTPHRQYLSGETHLYLGRQYRLKAAVGVEAHVWFGGGLLHVVDVTTPSRERIEELLKRWYRTRAQEVFPALYRSQWAKSGSLFKTAPALQIRQMRTRWGSLSKGGILTLNADLVRGPKACIEYVICHEFCHLVHHDHGAAFYGLLESLMPDWQARKHKLELMLI